MPFFLKISSGEAYLVYSKKIYSNSDFNQYVAALYKVVGTFLFGAAVSQSLTDLAKFTIGRPRPNFMAVCAPKVCMGYMQRINCTGKPLDVTESRWVCKHLNIKLVLMKCVLYDFVILKFKYLGFNSCSVADCPFTLVTLLLECIACCS